MRLLKTSPQLVLEAIDHQSGEFYETLVSIIESGKSASAKGLIAKGIDKDLAVCIKRFTNLIIKLELVDSYAQPGTAWIIVPVTDVNHAILNEGVRDYYDYFFDGKSLISEVSKKPGLLSRVDISKGRVYGDYANIEAEMTIGDEFFNSQWYTAEEAAAVILHEVGHYFSYVEFLTSSITTNFVLSQMAAALSRTTNPKERESYIIAAKQILGSSSRVSAEELSQANNPGAVQIVLVKDYIETKRTEFGYDVFNESTWEAMADQFAARQGAGGALLTALDKIMRRYGSDIAYRGRMAYYLIEVLKTVFAFSLYLTVPALLMILNDSANTVYGRLPVRFERIRAELIDRLKDRKLSAKEKASITQDIEVADRILKTVSDQRQWFSYVAEILFSGKRDYYKAEAVSRELEKLGASDFFLQAAKLSAIASLLKKQA
jgi:hypothetical protein